MMRGGGQVVLYGLWACFLPSDAVVVEMPVPTLSGIQAVQDIEYAWDQLLAVHPDPFRRTSRHRLRAAFDALIEGLPDRLTPFQLYLGLAPILARLEDSHTALRPRELPLEAYLPISSDAGSLFLSVEIGETPAGSRVLEIGGIPGRTWYERARRLTSAETETLSDALAGVLVPALVHNRWPEKSAVEMLMETPSGKLSSLTIGDGPAPRLRRPIQAKRLPEQVVYVAVRTLTGDPIEVSHHLDDFFGSLNAWGTRGLIIDLRENGGGNTSIAETLLNRITRRPYRVFAAKRWRVSEEMKTFVGGQSTHQETYLSAEPGTTVVTTPEVRPGKREGPSFDGPVVVLVGPKTLSAAMMMANAVRDYRLALLAGEPTGSPPNYFGEVYRTELPLSGLPLDISSAEFIRANGDGMDPEPVLPDLLVARSVGQPARHDDETVRAAFRAIQTMRSVTGWP
ncbi:MAG: S41 family peptidase [Myxococcota bacterium]